jgi:hypothetical protein
MVGQTFDQNRGTVTIPFYNPTFAAIPMIFIKANQTDTQS